MPTKNNCPWCGSNPTYRRMDHVSGNSTHYYKCEEMSCRANPCVGAETEDLAAASWDMRHEDNQPKPKALATENCGICKENLRTYVTYYESRVIGGRAWAWMCLDCWKTWGAGIGTGHGQEYDSTTNLKIRG